MKRHPRQKKQLFLLLELMVALSLVAFCAIPLVRTPYFFLRKQTKALQEVQLHLEAEKALAEVKEKFYTNTISWDEIEEAVKTPFLISQELVTIPPLSTSYIKTCTLKSAMIKQAKNEEIWAKVSIEVAFSLPSSKESQKKFLHTLSLCQKDINLEI